LDDRRSLDQARARYTDLFDFAPVTYALLDGAGLVLKVNLAGCRLLNVARGHLTGHPLLAFVVQQDKRTFLEHLRRCRGRKGVVESELRFSSSSRLVTCRLYSKRASYEDGDAFPTVIIDKSEHLALDEALQSAERRRVQAERASEIAQAASAAKDRFLATVSHELRTPLTPALFAASRLASWDGLPDQARRLAATIKRNVEFEARVIDDLLDVARIRRDRISLQLVTADIHLLLREAVGICSSFAAAKGVTVTAHLIAAAHHANADRARLRQVFWNVLNNAIKFTDVGGSIVVRSVNVGESVLRLSVRDTGAGMDSTMLETLFAPFDRRPVEHESRMGLGLGLAICKGIIGAHGGHIWATSDGPGRGSTFAVELATAAEPPPEEAGAGAPAVADTFEARPRRVLVIEDDADSSEMLALFLSQQGYEVAVASSLGVGISRLDEHWDVVLSDIGLPDGSGLEVAKRARRMPQPPQRLIAFTGYGSGDDIRASRTAGFDDHVVKPIDLELLLNTLRGASTPASDSQ
jgi:signal transduction histidine kinase/ActR/RegA family two-component response regulator